MHITTHFSECYWVTCKHLRFPTKLRVKYTSATTHERGRMWRTKYDPKRDVWVLIGKNHTVNTRRVVEVRVKKG